MSAKNWIEGENLDIYLEGGGREVGRKKGRKREREREREREIDREREREREREGGREGGREGERGWFSQVDVLQQALNKSQQLFSTKMANSYD